MATFPLFYSAFSEVISNNPKNLNNLWRLKIARKDSQGTLRIAVQRMQSTRTTNLRVCVLD